VKQTVKAFESFHSTQRFFSGGMKFSIHKFREKPEINFRRGKKAAKLCEDISQRMPPLRVN
jgi:hypothetical protein